VLVHDLAEQRRLAGLERLATAVAELLDVVQVVDHRRVGLPGALILILQDVARAAREPGEEQQQVILELVERGLVDRERLGADLAGAIELEARDPAVGGDVLVLLADRPAEPVDLDLAGEPREIARQQQAALEAVQRLEQRRGEAARRAEPGAGRDIASVVISCWSSAIPIIANASRTIGCSICSIRSTCSIFEYLRRCRARTAAAR